MKNRRSAALTGKETFFPYKTEATRLPLKSGPIDDRSFIERLEKVYEKKRCVCGNEICERNRVVICTSQVNLLGSVFERMILGTWASVNLHVYYISPSFHLLRDLCLCISIHIYLSTNGQCVDAMIETVMFRANSIICCSFFGIVGNP